MRVQSLCQEDPLEEGIAALLAMENLKNSFLENPMDRGTWQATVYRVAKNQT